MSNNRIFSSYSFSQLHKFWAIGDYEDDHLNFLKEKEDNRILIKFKSGQIAKRPTLVRFIKNIAIQKQLDQLSIHLAVYILDVFMDMNDIKIERLKLVALVALLLATKFEERDSRVLKVSDVNIFAKHNYLFSEYRVMESVILQFLNWNMNIPTVVHFVNIYLEFLFSDDEISNLSILKSSAELWSDVRYFVKKYMDYVMDDITLMHETPSKVAAAIMACTRINLKLSTIYPSQLFVISRYRFFDLKVLIGRLKNGMRNINNNL